jgi:hypothetical protein
MHVHRSRGVPHRGWGPLIRRQAAQKRGELLALTLAQAVTPT